MRQEELFRKGPAAHGIEDAVYEFATLANEHVLTARSMFKDQGGKVPSGFMPVFMAGVRIFLKLCNPQQTYQCTSRSP